MAKGMIFYCQNCGQESSKWMGQCPGCKEWNTFVEEAAPKKKAGLARVGVSERKAPVSLNSVSVEDEPRVTSGMEELDRVLGGGIVAGSLLLVGGDPGIGKSTLLLQVCRNLSLAKHHVLYISGEESLKQIKLRAQRIGEFTEEMKLLCETNLETIEEVIKKDQPEVVVIDSIQTIFSENVSSAPGSVSQVRETTATLLQLGKGYGITIFIVGHVTKEGVVAGPRVLEHMVDTVLYFEGEKNASYRILRGVKNRFGSTNEIGVFEMHGDGLKEVKEPSKFMLEGRPEGASGSVVACSMEGTRPILLEIQALVSDTSFQIPRRTSVGIDYNRVNLLMAVLEKKIGMRLGGCDAYVNLTGGMRLTEPAIDLAIVAAIVSSYRNVEVDGKTIFFGEVGLAGEIRSVSQALQRVKEAEKMGFDKCILPKTNTEGLKDSLGKMKIKLIGISSVQDLMDVL